MKNYHQSYKNKKHNVWEMYTNTFEKHAQHKPQYTKAENRSSVKN